MVRAATSLLAAEDVPARPPLLECVAGDAAAWRALHRQYYPVAAAFLRKLGVTPAELEDACQDVFLQLFRYLPGFRGESEFETWLYRLCLTQARRVRLRQRVSRLLSWLPGEDLVSGPSFSEHSARQRIEAALARLSAADRSVLVLYEMEGLPGARIAEIVGCKEATLWRRLHYARKRFLEALEQTEVAP
ncbi:MAG: RNA polymerase sigma factor [Polyangiaceae bacterium]